MKRLYSGFAAVLLTAPLWTQPAMALTLETHGKDDRNAARYADPDGQVQNFNGQGNSGRGSPFQFSITPPRGNTLSGPQRGERFAPGTGLAPLIELDRNGDQRR